MVEDENEGLYRPTLALQDEGCDRSLIRRSRPQQSLLLPYRVTRFIPIFLLIGGFDRFFQRFFNPRSCGELTTAVVGPVCGAAKMDCLDSLRGYVEL